MIRTIQHSDDPKYRKGPWHNKMSQLALLPPSLSRATFTHTPETWHMARMGYMQQYASLQLLTMAPKWCLAIWTVAASPERMEDAKRTTISGRWAEEVYHSHAERTLNISLKSRLHITIPSSLRISPQLSGETVCSLSSTQPCAILDRARENV